MFFQLRFSTLNTSHHTPFMCVSIPPPRLLYLSFVYKGSQMHCAAEQLWRCNVLTVRKFQKQKAVDGYMASLTQSQPLQSSYYQPAVLYIHSLTINTITNPTTDSWTVTFPQTKHHTHITVHCYKKVAHNLVRLLCRNRF